MVLVIAFVTFHGTCSRFASNADRIKSNFQQIELSDEDFRAISDIGRNNHTRCVVPRLPVFPSFLALTSAGVVPYSFNVPITYDPPWPINVFNEPSERNAPYKLNIGA